MSNWSRTITFKTIFAANSEDYAAIYIKKATMGFESLCCISMPRALEFKENGGKGFHPIQAMTFLALQVRPDSS